MISHSMYSSATALQFSCKRRGRGCCKINCKLEKLEIWGENGKQEMIDYTFHETNVSRRVLHKQRLDPKPAFHTPVLHTLPSLPHTIDDTTAILSVILIHCRWVYSDYGGKAYRNRTTKVPIRWGVRRAGLQAGDHWATRIITFV